MTTGFFCHTCGRFHPELPMDFGADAPAAFYTIPEEEREARCELNPDLCVIDEREFFIRGCLEVPVVDGARPFVWGVWTSMSEKSYKRTLEIWKSPGPETLLLKTNVHTRPLGERPFVEVESTDHPLAVEQRTGITMDRVREIVERLMHEQH